jgi:hypothetical protein
VPAAAVELVLLPAPLAALPELVVELLLLLPHAASSTAASTAPSSGAG